MVAGKPTAGGDGGSAADADVVLRLAESGLIAVVTATREQTIWANSAFRRLVGYSEADLAAGRLDWRAMTPPEWVAAELAALAAALAPTATVTEVTQALAVSLRRAVDASLATLIEADPARGMLRFATWTACQGRWPGSGRSSTQASTVRRHGPGRRMSRCFSVTRTPWIGVPAAGRGPGGQRHGLVPGGSAD